MQLRKDVRVENQTISKEASMEHAKTLSAILIIIAVFMVNYLCGVWVTRHGKKLSKPTDPLR